MLYVWPGNILRELMTVDDVYSLQIRKYTVYSVINFPYDSLVISWYIVGTIKLSIHLHSATVLFSCSAPVNHGCQHGLKLPRTITG